MLHSTFSLTKFLTFTNVIMSSVLVILAFSLLGYTLTYNFRNSVARRFALLLGCLMIVYAGDVALTRVVTADSTERWLRFQWLGIAILPAAAYLFSLAVPVCSFFYQYEKQPPGIECGPVLPAV